MSYWAKRIATRQAGYLRSSASVIKKLSVAHKRALDEIHDDTARIIGSFQKAFGLTRQEAMDLLKSPLSAAESRRLYNALEDIADPAMRRAAEARVSSLAYTHRITHRQGLRASIDAAMGRLADIEQGLNSGHLHDVFLREYNRSMFDVQQEAGLLFSFQGVDERRARQVLRNRWSGKNYSQRVWANNSALGGKISQALIEGILQGKTSRATFDEIEQLSTMGLFAANRLLTTETVYVANQAIAEAYEEAGIKQYRFIAVLDSRTSALCQEHDGKVYNVSEQEPGVNMPPLHPYCRSSIAPEISGLARTGMQRRARDPKTGKESLVPASLTYKEWRAMQNA